MQDPPAHLPMTHAVGSAQSVSSVQPVGTSTPLASGASRTCPSALELSLPPPSLSPPPIVSPLAPSKLTTSSPVTPSPTWASCSVLASLPLLPSAAALLPQLLAITQTKLIAMTLLRETLEDSKPEKQAIFPPIREKPCCAASKVAGNRLRANTFAPVFGPDAARLAMAWAPSHTP